MERERERKSNNSTDCQTKRRLQLSRTESKNTRFEKHLLPFYLALLNGLLVYTIPLVNDLKRMEKRIVERQEYKQCIFMIIVYAILTH